ncbi:protoporphyrinogen oxidase [Hymenobacter psychrophilus]|uniref:Coproporphyrinogen III oxidase n=1 Tax=Hymenobacter psychrophilus TaxID=651662 RepID=A0A1H3IM77_9BACT|nr:protoporphyrinogen oxidase [Hymenobacter psychrophilus]SDY28886.1 oxygen-dependent protoporphyrinogen oxidase [Hymenobacter psychrophilus]
MAIAIIGGGISGLTLAWGLQRAGVDYDLFEADTRPGGTICSEQHEGYLLEVGPNSLQLSDELAALFGELGLNDKIQDAAAVSQNRYVLRAGAYQPLPGTPPGLLTSKFFSLKGRYNMVRELFRKPEPVNELETLSAFFTRRFGPEVVEYALNPFISGIYAGDPAQLLLHKTFPQLAALEQQHGSVLRGLMKGKSKAGRRRIVSLAGGLQTLPATLAAKLRRAHFGQAATRLHRHTDDGRWELETTAGPAPRLYKQVVLALPTYAAAPLLAEQFPEQAAALAAVYYPPMAAVYTAYQRADVGHPLNGFGALHPKAEQPYAAGSIWTSSLFPNRAPAGQVLFTTFVGGTQYESQARESAAEQQAAVHAELSRFYGLKAGAAPVWQHRYFWPRAIPQFDARIVPAHAAADALQALGLHATANWRAGAGVPDCVRHARQLAATLAAAR